MPEFITINEFIERLERFFLVDADENATMEDLGIDEYMFHDFLESDLGFTQKDWEQVEYNIIPDKKLFEIYDILWK